MTILNPYISFRGDARAAMEFYQQALGGDLQVMTFGDMPGMVQDEVLSPQDLRRLADEIERKAHKE